MKIEGYLFVIIAVFLFGTAGVYWVLSEDTVGTTCIAFSGGLAIIVGAYLTFTATRIPPRPEDRGDADISEGSGELGFFSPGSYWPIALAGGATLAGLGLVFGIWLLLIGLLAVLVTVWGLLFEYYVRE